VLLDSEQRRIVKTAKVLTTHHDLRICIEQVLDCLATSSPEQVRLASISTTLATNAIVEGKSRPVGLFLLGYDPQLVYQYGFQRQFSTERFFFIPGGMDLRGQEQAPLDEDQLAARAAELAGHVEAFAVSSYAGTLNASHEERAGELLHRLSGLPVVQGHHLTSRLNSVRRATTASLNAGLLSTAYDFLNTVQGMLKHRRIDCPLIVVRGDGSLVSADFAAHRPVEIIHSGPATSAIGGQYLARLPSALVIDVGGTTTDLALVHEGRVLLDGGEATVGGYHTSVRTIRARSFGLGGDSQIRFTPRGEISVGPERVLPLSLLAQTYPEVKRDLEAFLIGAPDRFYADKLEYWLLRREPRQPFSDPRTNRALELLRGGPRRLAWLLKQAGAVSAVQVDVGPLLRQDIIARAGLTPTDLLHVTGEYAPWEAGVAHLAVETIARMLGQAPAEFIAAVRQRMTRKITAEIVHFLTGHSVPEEKADLQVDSLAGWLFDENLSGSDPFLGCRFQLKTPVVGIGAPARCFLPPVAEALGAEICFPDHYEVANAVGTVVGNVLVQKEVEVLPRVDGAVATGYLVQSGSSQSIFTGLGDALAFARECTAGLAREEALQAGARDPAVEVSEQELLGGIYRFRARAVGKPGG
jgi:N-methylhydantoinase A/oxoprolinase/acetone carboxylase beta subunit